MRESSSSWWKQLKYWVPISIVVFVIIFIALMIIRFGWDLTGFFGDYDKLTKEYAPDGRTVVKITQERLLAKTLWDWLQLLIIPIMLAIVAYLFNLALKKREQDAALDTQQEEALQAYIKTMSELLLDKNLAGSPSNPQVESVAQAQTVTVLRTLDPIRRGSLIRFLSHASILEKSIGHKSELESLDLHEANLTRINLSKIDLRNADLRNAKLMGANLGGADLREAKLMGADLREAKLMGTDLREADLGEANLRNVECSKDTNFIRARLRKADLWRANLREANLREANLREANLREAKLMGADLADADLTDADLTDADLTGAIGTTPEQLKKQAKSLKNITLPNGQKTFLETM